MSTLQKPALERQIGGNHYKQFAIQPVEYTHKNRLNFLAGCVIKRICRYNLPTGKGRQDLEKAIHEIELLIDFNDDDFDGPEHRFKQPNQLPIQPHLFGSVNALTDEQTSIVQLLTNYNRLHSKPETYLRIAITTLQLLIEKHYPA